MFSKKIAEISFVVPGVLIYRWQRAAVRTALCMCMTPPHLELNTDFLVIVVE